MTAIRAIGLALLLATSSSVQAQSTTVLPSPAQRCLTRGQVLLGVPEYPQRAYDEKASGRVTVELEFVQADAPPRLLEIKVADAGRSDYADAFDDSVRRFIEAYRVPCLPAGETSRLKQEFVFLPHDRRGITLVASTDEREARAHRLQACLVHRDPKRLPAYPSTDLRSDRQGTAVVRVEFADAQNRPRVTVLDDGGSERFGEAARTHSLDLSLPCHDNAGPVEYLRLYLFRIEGGSRVVLKDMPLPTLVRSFKGVRSAQVYFDFNTMGCPFGVHFRPMQPHARNDVGEVGPPNPERRFFLDWLSRQQLELPPRDLNAVIGQDARVSVPCTVLHLGTNSGGGASQ